MQNKIIEALNNLGVYSLKYTISYISFFMVIKFLKLQLGQFDKLDWIPDQNFWKLNLANKYIFGWFFFFILYVQTCFLPVIVSFLPLNISWCINISSHFNNSTFSIYPHFSIYLSHVYVSPFLLKSKSLR